MQNLLQLREPRMSVGETTGASARPSLDDRAAAESRANAEAMRRLFAAEPTLVDVQPALKALPGMAANVVLTSGPPLPWPEYTGGQRRAIAGAVVYEGLAPDLDAAVGLLDAGEV